MGAEPPARSPPPCGGGTRGWGARPIACSSLGRANEERGASPENAPPVVAPLRFARRLPSRRGTPPPIPLRKAEGSAPSAPDRRGRRPLFHVKHFLRGGLASPRARRSRGVHRRPRQQSGDTRRNAPTATTTIGAALRPRRTRSPRRLLCETIVSHKRQASRPRRGGTPRRLPKGVRRAPHQRAIGITPFGVSTAQVLPRRSIDSTRPTPGRLEPGPTSYRRLLRPSTRATPS